MTTVSVSRSLYQFCFKKKTSGVVQVNRSEIKNKNAAMISSVESYINILDLYRILLWSFNGSICT